MSFVRQPPLAPSHRRPAKLDRFWFGVAYYPEHWDEATRLRDAKRMKSAGINVVRMAEFAWDMMEPEQGRFDFELFDSTIRLLGEHGIETFLCTPTAAAPAWLTRQQPEVLAVDAQRTPFQHGSRQHCCIASPAYRAHSCRITSAMAEHFAGNPHVIGWQTDNEIHCHVSECYCDACRAAFQDFLQRRYDSIDALNRAWGTSFWAQSYRSFEGIGLPRLNRPTHPNPGQQLDYVRFRSAAAAEFQRQQVEILRSTDKRWIVFHNGIYPRIDYHGPFVRDLDLLGYDCYPLFDGNPRTRRTSQALNLDRARAWSGNFIIPEQQSGPGGQAPYLHDTPEPGEMRRMTYTSIAHGCDSLLHFRWRSCRFGAEEYWCGILDHDDVPRRRFDELCQEGRELQRIGPEILGTHVRVDVAVAQSVMEVTQAHAIYPLGLPKPERIAGQIYALFNAAGFATGCIRPDDDLTDVRLYVIPHWALFDPEWVPGLVSFVNAGGVLVIGARTGSRDMDNTIVSTPLPGCLRELAGVEVTEYGKQNCPDLRPLEVVAGDQSVASQHWYEHLLPDEGTEIVAQWRGRFSTGQAAVTRRGVGRGAVYYVGTYMTGELLSLLLPRLIEESGLQPLLADIPVSVEVVVRENEQKRLWFVMNHGDEVELALPAGKDLIADREIDGRTVLPRHGVAVIRQQRA